MPFKVVFVFNEASGGTRSLATIGSFDNTCIAEPLRKYVEAVSKCGDFDVYISNGAEIDNNTFCVLDFSDNATSAENRLHMSNLPMMESELVDRLMCMKAERRKRKPSRDEPLTPRWITGVFDNCFERPDFVIPLEFLCDDNIISILNTWEFTALKLNREQLVKCAFSMLAKYKDSLHLDLQRLANFIFYVEANYRPNSYHNYRHAVDVMQSMYQFIEMSKEQLSLTALEQFSLLAAAYAHDVGHFGFKNKFVIDTEHPLSVLYNDRSPVENYHCLLLFSILRQLDCQFECNWDATMKREFRRIVTSVILATDMAHHFDFVRKFSHCANCAHAQPCLQKFPSGVLLVPCDSSDIPSDRTLIMIMLLKAADLSNVIRPFEIAERWGACLQSEFYHQVYIFHVLNRWFRAIGENTWALIAPFTTIVNGITSLPVK